MESARYQRANARSRLRVGPKWAVDAASGLANELVMAGTVAYDRLFCKSANNCRGLSGTKADQPGILRVNAATARIKGTKRFEIPLGFTRQSERFAHAEGLRRGV